MARQHPIELFMPPNMLKAKVGGGLGGIDPNMIKRAEAAVETLSGEFAGWLADDVKKLAAARAVHAATPDAPSRRALLRTALDIKSEAATFHFPLIGRLAGSLARLIDEMPAGRDVPPGLIDAHVDAVQVIHREAIQDDSNRMAVMLCTELDARVTEALALK